MKKGRLHTLAVAASIAAVGAVSNCEVADETVVTTVAEAPQEQGEVAISSANESPYQSAAEDLEQSLKVGGIVIAIAGLATGSTAVIMQLRSSEQSKTDGTGQPASTNY